MGVLLLHFSSATPLAAQLRPLDPLPWAAVQQPHTLHAAIGLGVFHDQPVSRTGSSGRLLELGNFGVSWMTGRVMLEASGTFVRRFDERARERPPADGVLDNGDAVVQDAGDFRIATIIRLTDERAATALALRFGTRLPTTDDRLGLDRDQTDFFALLGTRLRLLGAESPDAALVAEAGVSINGTRVTDYEQADVLVYALGGEYRWHTLTAHLLVTGQDDLHDWAVRGNEDLAELRLGVRAGGARWLQLSLVRGLAGFSPRGGVLLAVGTRWTPGTQRAQE